MKRITIGTIPGDSPAPLTLDVGSLVANRLLIQANSGGGIVTPTEVLFPKALA